jgi:hypothetical protein
VISLGSSSPANLPMKGSYQEDTHTTVEVLPRSLDNEFIDICQ